MNNNKDISNKNIIIRLSRYKNALVRFKYMGLLKVFSDNLADSIGVTPSVVRKDFSLFELSGNKRGGYNVDDLLEKLNHILNKNEIQKVIIVGAGKLGTALLKYKGFEKEGIHIVASFDTDPSRQTKDSEIPIMPLEEMNDFVAKNNIKIGIIAVPEMVAQQVSDMMAGAGVKGILNFAPIRLRPVGDCIISNVNLEVELENLIYFVKTMDKEKTGQ